MKSLKNIHIVVVCDNIRSTHNVGSIFRTSDAAGISGIYLCGITPCPPRPDIHKVALGAEETVPFIHRKSTKRTVSDLKKKGYHILALENNNVGSIDYRQCKVTKPTAIVLGGEVTGIPHDIMELVDEVVFLPMRGHKESLNVSVAFGIMAYHLTRELA